SKPCRSRTHDRLRNHRRDSMTIVDRSPTGTPAPGEPSRPDLPHAQGSAQRPASGCGPETDAPPSRRDYDHPAAGWGAALNVGKTLVSQRTMRDSPAILLRMNHDGRGFDCPGCAWPDDQKVHLDICENGIKHAAWEMTPKRAGREFFAKHSVTELMTWSDFALEDAG